MENSEKPVWVLDAKGDIVTHPLTGWSCAQAFGSALILQLQYLQDGSSDLSKPDRLQIVLTPLQALELAEVLARAGQFLLSGPGPHAPTN
jgi:hypothetical protein